MSFTTLYVVQDDGEFATFYLRDVDASITSIINDVISKSSTHGYTLTNVDC